RADNEEIWSCHILSRSQGRASCEVPRNDRCEYNDISLPVARFCSHNRRDQSLRVFVQGELCSPAPCIFAHTSPKVLVRTDVRTATQPPASGTASETSNGPRAGCIKDDRQTFARGR